MRKKTVRVHYYFFLKQSRVSSACLIKREWAISDKNIKRERQIDEKEREGFLNIQEDDNEQKPLWKYSENVYGKRMVKQGKKRISPLTLICPIEIPTDAHSSEI